MTFLNDLFNYYFFKSNDLMTNESLTNLTCLFPPTNYKARCSSSPFDYLPV